MDIIKINDVDYVKFSDVDQKNVVNTEWLSYVVVRTYSAGVHAGYLQSQSKDKTSCVLLNSRRLWYWDWAFTLSAVAKYWVEKPNNCKFSCEIDEIELVGCVEYIKTTKKSFISLTSVLVWKQ